MKITCMECPKCGANVRFLPGRNTALCPHCNSQLALQDDVRRVEIIHRDERPRRRSLTSYDYDEYDDLPDDEEILERRRKRREKQRAEKQRQQEETEKKYLKEQENKRENWIGALEIWLIFGEFLLTMGFTYFAGIGSGIAFGCVMTLMGAVFLTASAPESLFPHDDKKNQKPWDMGLVICGIGGLVAMLSLLVESEDSNNTRPEAPESSLTDTLTELTAPADETAATSVQTELIPAEETVTVPSGEVTVLP